VGYKFWNKAFGNDDLDSATMPIGYNDSYNFIAIE